MIVTPRLLLRRHRLNDLLDTAVLFGDAGLMRFIGGTALCAEDVWNRLLRYAGHWALFGFGLFAIEERSTGRFVGEAGFAHFHRGLGERFDPFPEAAWILAADVHGRGYALEAMTAALAWLDERDCGPRSVCIIHPDNLASRRLAAALGYHVQEQRSYRNAPTLLHERLRNGVSRL